MSRPRKDPSAPLPRDPLDDFVKPGKATEITIVKPAEQTKAITITAKGNLKGLKNPGPLLRRLIDDAELLQYVVETIRGVTSVEGRLPPSHKDTQWAIDFAAKYLWLPVAKKVEVSGEDGGPIQVEGVQRAPIADLRAIWRKLGATKEETDAAIVEDDEG